MSGEDTLFTIPTLKESFREGLPEQNIRTAPLKALSDFIQKQTDKLSGIIKTPINTKLTLIEDNKAEITKQDITLPQKIIGSGVKFTGDVTSALVKMPYDIETFTNKQ